MATTSSSRGSWSSARLTCGVAEGETGTSGPARIFPDSPIFEVPKMYLFSASDRSVVSEGGETGSQFPPLGGFKELLFLAARMRSWYGVEKDGPMDLPK